MSTSGCHSSTMFGQYHAIRQLPANGPANYDGRSQSSSM
jgi:hypothetical protein